MSAAISNGRISATEETQTVMLDIGRLLPNPLNPRGEVADDDVLELMRSIKEHGILQGLLVVPYRDAYYIVAGHRRRHAARLGGLTKVPCVIRELSEDEQQDIMLVENIQRKDLTPLQEARAFQRRIQGGCSIVELVERLSLSRGYIDARLNILRLEQSVQDLFQANLLPIGAASILALVTEPARQKHFASIAVQQHLPLGKLETLVRETVTSLRKQSPDSGGSHYKKQRALNERELFTRTEAVNNLQALEGEISYQMIADAFNDVCDGVCVEEDGNREMCEACPAPRLIASLLKRAGIEIEGRKVAM